MSKKTQKNSNDIGVIVGFRFTLSQTVITPFGEKAIVLMLGSDSGGRQYFVKMKGGASTWFPEQELKPSA